LQSSPALNLANDRIRDYDKLTAERRKILNVKVEIKKKLKMEREQN